MTSSVSSANTGDTILLCQSRWVHTQNTNTTLITRGIGSSYVLAGYHPTTQIRFLAHVIDENHPTSIQNIFERLMEDYPLIKKEGLRSLQVSLIGGWKSHPESSRWGNHIRSILAHYGIEPITRFFQKKDCQITRISEALYYEQINTLIDGFQEISMPPLSIEDKNIKYLTKDYPPEDPECKSASIGYYQPFLTEKQSLEIARVPLLFLPEPEPELPPKIYEMPQYKHFMHNWKKRLKKESPSFS